MKFDGKWGVALIFSICVQTATALIWAGGASARLAEVERRLADQRPVAERLARLEAQAAAAQLSLDRIERRLEARGR